MHKLEKVVSARKMKILEHLHHYGVSTIDQIKREFFQYKTLTLAYSEMRSLLSQKLVEKIYLEKSRRPKGIYLLSGRGAEAISEDQKDFLSGQKYKPQSLLHDLELVDIAYFFKRPGSVKNYCTENQLLGNPMELYARYLEKMAEFRPDALVELENQKASYFFALEYEANLKSSGRIRSKINRYYEIKNISGCLFIGRTNQIIESVKSIEARDNSKFAPKIFYCTLEEIKNHDGKIIFYDRKNEKLSIG